MFVVSTNIQPTEDNIIRERRNSRKKRRKKCGWRSEREGGEVRSRVRDRIAILVPLSLFSDSFQIVSEPRSSCCCCRRCYVHSVFTVEHNRNLTA
ncbi:hypothetical protein ALC56_03883 [Trachymyrmex septentrionalis]|uniref:Uncharacterized protein n=1 Tax=Trachymyrmex septentrionalis TaxID=34720 RepID=A0A195FM14_9HYME|nr:hypothetical protein ALC56_03883 [Trachymyrmex septentrionalis]